MAKSKSSKNWLREHSEDKFVRMAREQGYRSRASFKLLEIHQKYSILQPGISLVDLGAAPGGWTQVAVQHVGPRGKVFALDLLHMDALPGACILQGDFTEDAVLSSLQDKLAGRRLDLVISDMAPNLSGMKEIDQPSAVWLMEVALDFAAKTLKPGGGFLVKAFQGEGIDQFRAAMKGSFRVVKTCKPEASRHRSREFYLLGTGLK